MNTFYGFKLGQSQEYDEAGKRWPVTLVRVEPVTVVGWKTSEKSGYDAVQITLGSKKHTNKPVSGFFKNLPEKLSPKYIREIKLDKSDQLDKFAPGEKVSIADVFAAGDLVKVSGVTKGKGFQGVVRRHGFKGGPHTHGQSDRERHPGSIGQTTTPGRVYKGKRMAGHMGTTQATVRNLKVFAVKPEENLLLVTGLVPGAQNGLLTIVKLSK